jgi:DnaK suppressor protein
MTHDQLFVFRQLLHSLRDQVLHRDKTTKEAISACYHPCPDLNDQASLESHRHMLILLGQRERGLIQKILAALGKLDDGSYGICEDCGDEIPFRRLQAQPMTSLCIHCQEELEQGPCGPRLAWA